MTAELWIQGPKTNYGTGIYQRKGNYKALSRHRCRNCASPNIRYPALPRCHTLRGGGARSHISAAEEGDAGWVV